MFATFYVKNYESKKRPWITISCTFFVFLLSQFYALPVTFLRPPIAYPIIFACASIISSQLLLNRLYRKNSQILDTSLNGTRKYSLSQQFQLEENLRVMWYLRGLGLLFFLGIGFIIGIIVLPWIIFGQESFYGRVIISMFDLIMSAVGILAPLICMFFLYRTNYQPFMKKMNLQNTEVQPERKNATISDTNTYFEQLQKSWN